MSGKRRFRGPVGAVFVPHPTVDETTIASKVASGEWTPVEESKPAKRAPAKPKSDEK